MRYVLLRISKQLRILGSRTMFSAAGTSLFILPQSIHPTYAIFYPRSCSMVPTTLSSLIKNRGPRHLTAGPRGRSIRERRRCYPADQRTPWPPLPCHQRAQAPECTSRRAASARLRFERRPPA
ncbi:hypothetical protein CYLTODRAFT_169599 [Cylindrobasidium torrendii FP15055 ss-10]|uniref:Uncharacterized protein n=1 Tax=Cylindrobasidium torrendii FP15055 ss-10 TaxID=1314674 RepID=A0A0D7AVP5_9AGAR|nr:hypothetical protein CYLTODRAFT_182645 [Cylindrobasidium torrendii FP15055 ss-10]KIY62626.1 hypothetical protein CYLTODRAFT_169599 [Cylindrobasidium torrendii FP15055 ss-10]